MGFLPPLIGLVKSPHYLCYTLVHVRFCPLQTKEANHNRILVMGLSSQIKNVYLDFPRTYLYW